MVPETGSFGKSTRRSRSRTGTPAAAKSVDPTIAAGEAIFTSYLQKLPTSDTASSKSNLAATGPKSASGQSSLVNLERASSSARFVRKDPTEVVLRGFPMNHQYAAIREYERIAGRICEDYPRDPPVEHRRFRSDLRDPAILRAEPLTIDERRKAMQYAGGNHWIKITYESLDAADAAIQSSPQIIQGYVITAELYRGCPPATDEAVPVGTRNSPRKEDRGAVSLGSRRGQSNTAGGNNHAILQRQRISPSPDRSMRSSQTAETGTVDSTGTPSTITVTGSTSQAPDERGPQPTESCSVFAYAKPMQLLPAEQALLPQKPLFQQFLAMIPFLSWFSSDIIGTGVPRTEKGDFDWAQASLYWKIVYWLDSWLHLFGLADEKEKDE